jgi:uncharacterized protein (TIGR00730 family)
MTTSGKKQDPAFQDAVSALLAQAPSPLTDARASRLLRGMVETCLAMAADGANVADLKLVESTLAEIRVALNCFRPHARTRKVTAFGSARTTPDSPEYTLARNFCRKIVEAGYMIITGAGPGIMSACQEGAGRARSFGVNIRLPFENVANEVIRGDAKLVEFKYFFTRKLFFLKEASALVLFPGGFGTHDESFESLTLVQTGKAQMMPIVFLDVPRGTYWKTWDRYVRDHILRRGLISPDDLALYKVTDSIDEAVREITVFYRNYHSSRFIRGRLVMRLNEPLGEERLRAVSDEFADVLGGVRIRPIEPQEEEFDEPALADLPRIVLAFDMRSYGRLRMLINRINEIV